MLVDPIPILLPPVTEIGFVHPYPVWVTVTFDAAVIVIFAVPADGLVAVTDAPTKLTVVIPSWFPTRVPSSWMVIPAIAGDPPPVTEAQDQPPEPFAVKT